ncbi:hypothetical protein E5S70_17555 [Ensifer adhaerens]|uniref:hypothetical protein n=1 Tax=Ensifer canadensis TaxID=555315 RepID=UPI00149062A0|nr:hypothetical protein [Ensifer canadensis]NOV17860.1 hypothetical protein [Ensifer canadensis]
MASAPRGKTVTVQRRVNGETREFEQFVSDPILVVHPNGAVAQSYWIPPRHTLSGALLEGNRWSGFNLGKEPIAWAPWPEYKPEHPGADVIVHKHTEINLPILEDCGSGA